jgi:cytochrome d ubiquinol oxidase subunit II
LELVRRNRFGLARIAVVGAPAGLLWGWALALYPWAIPGQVRLTPAPDSTAALILGVLLAGLAIVIPSYVLMLRVLRAPATPATAPRPSDARTTPC